MYNKVRNYFPGGGRSRPKRGRAPRRELQCIEGATVESTNTRSWMLPIVAPRGRRQGQPSCKRRRRAARGTLGDGVAVCRTRRVVSFGLIGRFLYVSGSRGGPDCACASGAPPHDLAVSPASPCKVSGARYRGSDIGTSLPTELLEYSTCCACPSWRRQAAVSPSVLFALPQLEQTALFLRLGDARVTRRPASAACFSWQRHTRDKSIAEPRAAAATPCTVAKRDNTRRRPRPSR